MSLIRWEPFTAMDDVFARLPGAFPRWPAISGAGDNGPQWAPSVDISETDAEYLIRAALPAVRKEDVEVTVENGVLKLSGERKQRSEQKDEKYHKVENFYGSFSRSFTLPDTIEVGAIRAESKDGVLTVHVPKVKGESSEPTTIKVQ
ncbi:MAG: Hsp20/alpha crystallin family protein [Proteobacteria bacterium]|nr:Hsp20/alpha crystallin family protein [Pseudomonadota bacterium]